MSEERSRTCRTVARRPATAAATTTAILLAFAATLLPGASADAQRKPPTDGIVEIKPGGDRLEWSWPRFEIPHLVLTGAALAGFATASLLSPAQSWDEPFALDEDVRDAIRLRDPIARMWARDASDVLLAFTVGYPYVVDALFAAAYYRRSPDVGVELALVTLETMLVSAAVNATVKALVGRERPYVRTCGEELHPSTHDCIRDDRHRSFFSGHASLAFTSASLTCMHHQHLPLYGGGAAGGVTCAAGYVLAGATAALRVLSDQHYLTDVAIGAVTGTAVGLLLPWLLHYRFGPPQDAPARGPGIEIGVLPTDEGIQVLGTF